MTFRRNLLPFLALLLSACLALFLLLGSRGLNEPDEGRYAEIGREMLETGDWVVPHLNGVPHFQKPPVLYWFTAASLGIGGVNEWAARMPSALAGLGTVLLTLLLGYRLRDFRTGLVAATVLLSSLEFFGMARLLTPDMLLTFWITAAIAALVEFHQSGHRRWSWAFFLFMGLGFLTKGPMALVVPLSAALAVCWERPRITAAGWALGLVVTLAVGLSWFVAVSLRHHELFHYFLKYELLDRFASATHGRSRPFWFFVPVLVAGFLPWIFFLPPAAARAWRKWRTEGLDWAGRLLAGWLVPPFIILSISGSKLPTYVLPLFPALALGVAFWWMSGEGERARRTGIWFAVALFALIPVAILTAPYFLTAEADPHFSTGYQLALAAAVFAGILAVLWGMKNLPRQAAVIPLAALALVTWMFSIWEAGHVSRLLGQQASVRPLAESFLKATLPEHLPLFVCSAQAHGFEFATGRLVGTTAGEANVVLDPTPELADRLFSSKGRLERHFAALPEAWGVIRSGEYGKTFPEDRWEVVERSGDFLLIRSCPPIPLANPPR